MRVGIVGLLVVAAACGSSGENAVEPTPATAATALCPVMWEWVKDVGAAFNDAAADVADIDGAGPRRERWLEALEEVEALNATLARDVEAYRDDPLLGALVAEIERDLPRSDAELDDIRALFTEHPEVDEGRHQDRTVQVIVRMEKVIDVAKPDLGPHDPDGTLLAAFRAEPACQHAIRGVDDGTAQSND